MPDADLIAIRMRLTGGKQVAAESEAAAKGIAQTGAAAQSASAKQAAAQAKLAKTATTLRSTGRALTSYVTLPVVGVGVAAGVMALDFDRSMRNVNSIAQLPEKRFNSLKQQVLDLAGPTAQAPKTLAEGLYDLVSSGFTANESIGILHKSALAASAGLTTTEVSTKAVAASLNAYHLPAQKAGWVSDTLFETVNRGVLTFQELAQSIGDTLPFAAQLNVPLNQVGAALATMTKQGLSSSEAVTRTKNVLVTLIKPGKELGKALDQLGMSGEELVKKEGLQGALEKIVGTTKGQKDEIAALFPNIRALGGVLSLVGKNAKFANEDLDAFKNTSGATAKVLHEQEKSFGFQLQRAWSKLQVMLIEIGDQLLPVVVPTLIELAGGVRDAVNWFTQLPEPLQHTLVGLTGMAALAGPLLLFASSVLKAATNLGILKATEAGGVGLNKGKLGKMALGGVGVAAIAAGQSGAGGKVGEAVGNIGGGAALGFSVGGPWGAAIGGGIGAAVTLAPVVADLLDSGPKLSALSKEVRAQTEHSTDAIKGYRSALANLSPTQKRAERAEQAHARASRNARAASSSLAHTLGRFGPESLPATRAQLKLARANRAVTRTSNEARNAQRLHGNALKLFRLETTSLVAAEKQRLPALRHLVKQLNERITKEPRNIALIRRTVKTEQALAGIKGKLTKAYAEAESKGSKPWAESLREMNSLQAKYGMRGKTLIERMGEQRAHLAELKTTGLGTNEMWRQQNRELKETVRLYEQIIEMDPIGGNLGKGPRLKKPGKNADGTNFWRGGLSLVGERGAELVDLPRGSRVIPAPKTRELLAPPQAAALARREQQGGTRYLVAAPVKIGRREVASVVIEAKEDDEARL